MIMSLFKKLHYDIFLKYLFLDSRLILFLQLRILLLCNDYSTNNYDYISITLFSNRNTTTPNPSVPLSSHSLYPPPVK